MSCLLVAVCVSLLLTWGCEARPDGAPTSACSTLTPVHSGIQPQRSEPPFRITVTKIGGNKLRIRIFSSVGEEFEGFSLQARSSLENRRLVEGRFTTKDGVTRTVNCFNGRENMLTQVNPSPKREVVTDWVPSGAIDENIIFRATVAKTFALFWTQIDSSPIKVKSDSSAGGSRSEKTEMGSSDRLYDNCFVNKGCFGLPAACINTMDCEVLLTFHKVSNGISFTMSGLLEPDSYMAVGVSRDALMGDDHVTECVRRGESTDIRVRNSWNDGKSNVRTKELSRDVYSSELTNLIASCSFTSDFLIETNNRQLNLENLTYFLLLAKGPMRNERLSYHTNKRISSQDPVNLTAFDMIEAEGISNGVKVHGAFMVTAWVCLVSLGILLARHFKSTWESRTICSVKVWFAFHRALMLLALAFVIIGIVVIFVHKGGWSYETSNPHPILGIVATVLGVLQPIMALFRPAPDHKNRAIFNWGHWTVGNAAHIIAIITIFFAVTLESSGLTESFYWIMAIFVVLHLIFHLAFQVHSWSSGKKKINEMKMLEISAGGRSGNSVTQNGIEDKGLAGNAFRIMLLGLYVIFIAVILLALYILIGVA